MTDEMTPAFTKALEELEAQHADGKVGDAEYAVKKSRLEVDAAAAVKADKRMAGCVWAAVLIPLLAIGGCFALIKSGGENDGSNDGATAIHMCRDSVRGKLKAPSTANFVSESVVSKTGNVFTIKGAVDSENSFGAKIRTTFTCQAGVEKGVELNAVATLEE